MVFQLTTKARADATKAIAIIRPSPLRRRRDKYPALAPPVIGHFLPSSSSLQSVPPAADHHENRRAMTPAMITCTGFNCAASAHTRRACAPRRTTRAPPASSAGTRPAFRTVGALPVLPVISITHPFGVAARSGLGFATAPATSKNVYDSVIVFTSCGKRRIDKEDNRKLPRFTRLQRLLLETETLKLLKCAADCIGT